MAVRIQATVDILNRIKKELLIEKKTTFMNKTNITYYVLYYKEGLDESKQYNKTLICKKQHTHYHKPELQSNTDSYLNRIVRVPFYYAFSNKWILIENLCDSVYTNNHIVFKSEWREYQKQLISVAENELSKNHTCLLSLCIASGKTRCALFLSFQLSVKTIIIVHRVNLIEQWKQEIYNVCIGAKVQIICSSNTVIDPTVDYYIINAINIHKYPIHTFQDIKCVILDEVHALCTKQLSHSFQYFTSNYVIGLSATPYRSDGMHSILEFYIGNSNITRELNHKHTVYAIHTLFKPCIRKLPNGDIDWNFIIKQQSEDVIRNNLIIHILTTFSKTNFLVLCKRKKHIFYLQHHLNELKENVSTYCGTDKYYNQNARILLSTTSKCGIGFNHPKLNGLIVATDILEYFIQYMGRVFRDPSVQPIIFDFVDNNPILQKHWKIREQTYIDSGGIVKHIDYLKRQTLSVHSTLDKIEFEGSSSLTSSVLH